MTMFTALNPLLTKNTSNMRIFLDTADIDEIRKADETGLIDGITTNPTLIRKAGKDPMDVYRDIANTGLGGISMEVTGTYEQMLNQAAVLCETFGDQAAIKLPMTEDGLKACKVLSPRVKTNITLVFNTAQAVLAAKAGAHYVSPFVGRIDDQGYAGLEVVRGIANLYCSAGVGTQVLAASIRTPHRAVRSFFNGASVVTMPPSVFWSMYKHVLTDVGLSIFDKDVQGVPTFVNA